MIGFSRHLPKLRARVTVEFPSAESEAERTNQLKQLQRGQCLPCGCEVIRPSWTLAHAAAKFYKALAEIEGKSEEYVRSLPDDLPFAEMELETKALRRLRDKFWIPDGSSRSAEQRDLEEGEKVLQMPVTIRGFIEKLQNINSGIIYVQCPDHWLP